MQFKNVVMLSAATLAATVSADGYTPGNPWSTLTPTATYSCGSTDYSTSFGIAIQTVAGSKAKRNVVSQIGDGQVQATSATVTVTGTASPSAVPTKSVVSQVSDGQVQHSTTSTGSTTTLTPTSSKTTSSNSACPTAPITLSDSSCKNDGTLEINLQGGVLTDGKGRIGSIVANRQFQFDGPPPQAGAIYAAGWSITPEGKLALGDSDVFYQCLSGNFYNLYDESIGAQCSPIHLEVVSLVDC